MKIKILMFCIFGMGLNTSIQAQDRLPKNNVGLSIGMVPAVNDMYFDAPFNVWPDRELSYVLQLSYARRFTEASLFGPFLEFERARFSVNGGDIRSFRKFNVGINWVGRYPQTKLHMQLGGFVGLGMLRADNWNDLWGPDAGMIAGPAFETQRFGLALHFQIGHAWFESTGVPTGVMLYNPKFLLKMYVKI